MPSRNSFDPNGLSTPSPVPFYLDNPAGSMAHVPGQATLPHHPATPAAGNSLPARQAAFRLSHEAHSRLAAAIEDAERGPSHQLRKAALMHATLVVSR